MTATPTAPSSSPATVTTSPAPAIAITTQSSAKLRVAVIGAGPVGLAAAAHLLSRGETPLVLEAGPAVGAAMRSWGHVRLFSPWRYVVDSASRELLDAHGWTHPDPDLLPTGAEIADKYLAPLADLPEIKPHVRLNTQVVSIARRGFDKLKSDGRDDAPFVVRVRTAAGAEDALLARAVIDASGTYSAPNPLGANGIAAAGEAALSHRIFYGIPDTLGTHRARYAGRRVAVVGSGHSAFNTLLDLTRLAEEAAGTAITWIVRTAPAQAKTLFGGGEDDELPARGALGQGVRRLVQSGRVRLVALRIDALEETNGGVIIRGQTPEGDDLALAPVDEVVACTGFRPDLSLTRELRLDLDPIVEAPKALAPLIDPNLHSCGSVPPHGAEELKHPDAGYYAVGMKSYGRAPTFLLLTGYEQVRSVAAAIAGDWDAARKVELVLPETGVCSTGGTGGCDDDDEEDEVAFIQVGEVGKVGKSAPRSSSVCCG